MSELDALLPAILDKAFRGELCIMKQRIGVWQVNPSVPERLSEVAIGSDAPSNAAHFTQPAMVECYSPDR